MPVTGNNRKLAGLFQQLADGYRYLGNEQRFRAGAYENAAGKLESMKEDIAEYAGSVKKLDALKGIGESIARKIIEYLQTGKIKKLEQLKKQVPFELLELMDITGFGPATLKILHDQLHINNKEELINALDSGKLRSVKGFGYTRVENMQRALKLFHEKKRIPFNEAQKIGEELLAEIKKLPGVQKAVLAGSLRRKKETIGDIDIVIAAAAKNRKKIVASLILLSKIERVLVKGSTKVSVLLKYKKVQADIRLVEENEWGAALLYFTGSKEHTIKLRTIAKERGYKVNEYGLFVAASGKKLAGAAEEEMYRALQMKYIPPEQREDQGEIEKAIMKKKEPT